MVYRRGYRAFTPGRGDGVRTTIVAVNGDADLSRVDGTFLRHGESKEYDFDYVRCLRNHSARRQVNSLLNMGVIEIRTQPTTEPSRTAASSVESLEARESKTSVESHESKTSVELPDDDDLPSSSSSEDLSYQTPVEDQPKDEDPPVESQPQPSAESAESVPAAPVEAGGDGAGGEGPDSADQQSAGGELTEEQMVDELSSIKGVSASQIQKILELGEWTEEGISGVRFMRAGNVPAVMEVLGRYQHLR